jgi:hypothetical protein
MSSSLFRSLSPPLVPSLYPSLPRSATHNLRYHIELRGSVVDSLSPPGVPTQIRFLRSPRLGFQCTVPGFTRNRRFGGCTGGPDWPEARSNRRAASRPLPAGCGVSRHGGARCTPEIDDRRSAHESCIKAKRVRASWVPETPIRVRGGSAGRPPLQVLVQDARPRRFHTMVYQYVHWIQT